ncbi:ABC transporter substrate-binding protein [Bifidobacterium scardovii]|uniref:Thiamine pyrimidine synthase n=1 Tax=Bifidobacterium scardovii TaxID=158787 RepID=A0A087DK89_9BIFI|nr:ABC transporter substrate-binding protein [Bifidobacterium scardovii]KFI95939.1 NMT1/THI5 like domain protein [Bifidobacterium scardovii]MDK6350506.1 ABC transporter substrate-binding protein [Bifidobacterium scardovii]MDU8981479.1 ABC transporter substrate-binding protein [Bifidobacterium scardovii]BAQ30686.1 putative ABC transporter substrate binding component [Bifidobacterium scardovii JCM 12489 = DSM 13734]
MLRVRLEYVHPWTNHAGMYLARERGLYAERGIDVEFTSGDFYRGDPAYLLARGEVDIALVRLNQLLFHQQGESSLLSFAVMNQCQIGGIITNKSTGITRFRDLEGKRVCIPMGVKRLYTELQQAVEKDGGDFSKLITIDPGEWEPDIRSVERGEFDAFINVAWWEPYQGSEPFDQLVVLPFDAIDVAPHHSYFVSVRREMLDRNPQLVRNFAEATAQGYAMAREDPAAAVHALQPPLCHIDPKVIAASLEAVTPSWFDADGNWGTANIDMVRSYTTWMAENGHLNVQLDRALASIDGGCITNALLPHSNDPMPQPLHLEEAV